MKKQLCYFLPLKFTHFPCEIDLETGNEYAYLWRHFDTITFILDDVLLL